MLYRLLFRLVISRMDAEAAHHWAFLAIQVLPTFGIGRIVARFTASPTDQSVQALGLDFPSPLGLAAGFDKNAKAVVGLGQLGFGHVEIGTVTAVPQPGNDRPRLFRLIPDRAIINRMGFNNDGAAAAAERIARLRLRRRRPIIGVNIGKSRVVAVDDAVADYRASARLLAPLADYLVINVSSPNTPGLRGLQELDMLAPLVQAVKQEAGPTPLLLKIAPDLTDEQVVRIVELVVAEGLDGIIATNTTITRDLLVTDAATIEAAGAGGLSGPPLADRSLQVLRVIRTAAPAGLCVISVGGVTTADQVAERLAAGATLVQAYTAFIYNGPLWARGVLRALPLRGTVTAGA